MIQSLLLGSGPRLRSRGSRHDVPSWLVFGMGVTESALRPFGYEFYSGTTPQFVVGRESPKWLWVKTNGTILE